MNAGMWRDVERIFGAALDLPEDAQGAYVLERCADEPAIRAEVESLLAAHRRSGDFLRVQTCAPATGDQGGARGGGRPPHALNSVGRAIGPYRLVEEIGRGGMGAVYRAERADDQFRQQVAIKLIVAGMETAETLRRFQAERQILANLEHPNIARLLDGGATADGSPYIVMQYVEGLPIHEYCRGPRLSIRKRLRLFQTICSAVHFAHQNLIVHRDIKPANILVTADGTPKLLDFGIAKILEPAGDRAVTQAASVMNAMTPEYASPEQLSGGSVTTASDVYSLGVLLYELLTGQRPYRVANGNLAEGVRAICEGEAEKPSAAAKRSGAEAAGELAGDLDAIVLKAMRKEPNRRYGSAEELSSDVGRYLAGLPVSAHEGSVRYVARKFASRHKVAVAAAGVAALLMVGCVAAIVREARVANVERAKAERRFNDVRKLAHSIINELDPQISVLPGSLPARKLLVARVLEYLNQLSKDTDGDFRLNRQIAMAYCSVGKIQGGTMIANTGDSAGAIASLEKARDLILADLDKKGLTARSDLAMVYGQIAAVHVGTRHYKQALACAESSIFYCNAVLHKSAGNEFAMRMLAGSEYQLGSILLGKERDGGEEHLRRATEIYESLLAKSSVSESSHDKRNLALMYRALSSCLASRHLHAAALEYAYLASRLAGELLAVNPEQALAKYDLSSSFYEIGNCNFGSGALMDALKNHRKALAVRVALAKADPQNSYLRGETIASQIKVGQIRLKVGEVATAKKDFHRAAELAETAVAADPYDGHMRAMLAEANVGIGDAEVATEASQAKDAPGARHRQKACISYRRALEMFRETERRGGDLTKLERDDAARLAAEVSSCAS